jgi:hypothetical protein
MRNLILIFIFIFSYSCNANEFDAAVGYCKIVMPGVVREPDAAYYSLAPLARVAGYALDFGKLNIEKLRAGYSDAKITVLQPPSHGVLIGEGRDTNYHPNPDGKAGDQDQVTFLVEVSGYKIKVVYFIHLGADGGDQVSPYCPDVRYKELSTSDVNKTNE